MPYIFCRVGGLGLQALRIERNLRQVKHRQPHVHRDAVIGLHVELQHALHGLHPHAALRGQPLAMDKAHEAARTVAAVLHLATVGVVDGVFEVDAWCGGRAYRQNLVRANAEVAVGQKSVLRGAQTQATLGFVEHYKVVTRALHFGEWDVHGAIICARWCAPKCKRPAASCDGP